MNANGILSDKQVWNVQHRHKSNNIPYEASEISDKNTIYVNYFVCECKNLFAGDMILFTHTKAFVMSSAPTDFKIISSSHLGFDRENYFKLKDF